MENLSKSAIGKKLDDIDAMLKASPELNNYPIEKWLEAHDFLKAEGFSPQRFAFMITQNPKLLIIPQNKLFNAINAWRGYQLGERQTISILELYPELLLMDHTKDLVMKISTVQEFIGGGSSLHKLLTKSPAALSQSLPVLKEKIDYLRNVMRVEPAEVYNSDVFAQDILTIKTRHNFLVRLGMFVARKKKDVGEISKNPKLYLITDTSDKRFATKVCFVTLDEYETFQEIYKKELDNDDTEEESDEENYDATLDTEIELERHNR